MTSSDKHEVIIVGAGPAGSAASYYLARSGIDVLLLDKSEFPRDKTCGDCLTPRAVGALEEIGVLKRIYKLAYRVNDLEFVSHNGKRISVSAKTKSSLPDYLLVIPRLHLDRIILQQAINTGAKFIGGSWVISMKEEGDRAQVTAQRGAALFAYNAPVVLMATGANTGLLRAAGLLQEKLPEPMLAVRAYYENVNDLGNEIQVHFFDEKLPGYGWVFPISASAANVGVGLRQTGTNKEKRSLRGLMESFLKKPLLKQMLSQATQIGVTKSYPLRSDFLATATVSGRVLAIGEAAGLVNPLTGDGIDFALESGKLAAEFLLEQFKLGAIKPDSFAQYDRVLRDHYQGKFKFFEIARTMLTYPIAMQGVFRLLESSQRARQLTADISLG